MPLFLIEHNFAERIEELPEEAVANIHQVNEDVGIEWLSSFLTADRRTTYCL